LKSDKTKSAIRGSYFFYSFALGSAFPFLAIYFKDSLGFNELQIGYILMARPLIAIIAQPFWSVMADTGGHRARLAFVLAVIAGIVFPLHLAVKSILLLMAMTSIWSFFNAPLNTLNDALAFQYLGRHRRMRFANFRIFASFGWAVAVICVGRLLDAIGIQWLFPFYTLGIFIAALFLWRIPQNEKTTWRQGLQAVRQLLAKRNVIFFLIAVFIFESANQMGYTFLSLYSRVLGASHIQVGMIWAVATLAEMVTMITFARIVRRINIKTVLVMGMLLTAVRWFPFGLMNMWWQILPLQLLHAFTLTFGYIGAATFLDMESSQEIRFSAQAFYSTFILNSGAICGAFFGGQISFHHGYGSLYFISGALTLIAAVVLVLFVKAPHKD
jgi:PPP family 3-phenylpropionic acid transporter